MDLKDISWALLKQYSIIHPEKLYNGKKEFFFWIVSNAVKIQRGYLMDPSLEFRSYCSATPLHGTQFGNQ
jgi:hypothetical protein